MERLLEFMRCERGTATVEALMWFALMTLFSTIVVDSTNAFYSYSGVYRSMQDGNRQLSVGRFKTGPETEAYIERELSAIYENADATVVVNGNKAETTVTIPWASFNTMGFMSVLGNQSVSFTSIHRIEWIP